VFYEYLDNYAEDDKHAKKIVQQLIAAALHVGYSMQDLEDVPGDD